MPTMLVQMQADRFVAGGILYTKGSIVVVSDDLALRWIGDNVAIDYLNARGILQGNLRAPRPRIVQRGTLRSCWMGKMQSLATGGADHSSRYYRTLETHTDRVRVGVLNCVPAVLTNLKVNFSTSDTLPGLNTSLAGSNNAPGGIISNGASFSSAAFDAAAGIDADAPTLTWSPWVDISTIDRVDVPGARPLLRVTLECPGATNANRPALLVARTRSNWENPANVGGRVMKCRSEVALAASNPGAGGTTAFSDTVMPIILEYQTRNGNGFTVTMFGDSLTEGADVTTEGYSWAYMGRDRVSTIDAPIELCMMAVVSTTTTEFRKRAEAVVPLLKPELVVAAMSTPNGVGAPSFTETGNARLQFRNLAAIKAVCADNNAAFTGWSGVPMNAIAPDITAGYKPLDAASAAALNKFMAQILARKDYVIDGYSPMVGGYDANGQAYLKAGTAAGNLHVNDAGAQILSVPFETFLRAVTIER